jgi:hypothetical protein
MFILIKNLSKNTHRTIFDKRISKNYSTWLMSCFFSFTKLPHKFDRKIIILLCFILLWIFHFKSDMFFNFDILLKF